MTAATAAHDTGDKHHLTILRERVQYTHKPAVDRPIPGGSSPAERRIDSALFTVTDNI